MPLPASGLVNTQLGPGEFLENLALWAEPDQDHGALCASPYPGVVEAPISMDDIARVAAALLVEAGAIAPRPDVCNSPVPKPLTRAQIAALFGVG